MRKKIIAGNWKMNFGPKEAASFVNEIKDRINTDAVDVVLCVPFINLYPVTALLKGTKIKVGAQNIHFEDKGAFTGEISAPMLNEMEVPYVIIGHSERRAYFGETDATVNKKVVKALENGLIPIVCVGESDVQRDQGITTDLVRMQTRIALLNIPKDMAKNIVIAYEPIWAIGTGRTATAAQAEEVCAAIRWVLVDIYDTETAESIRIQYGGSVTPENASELFAMPNIDGGLVGGASLKPTFERIVHFG